MSALTVTPAQSRSAVLWPFCYFLILFLAGEDVQWAEVCLRIRTCKIKPTGGGLHLSKHKWCRLHFVERVCSLCVFELRGLGCKRLVCLQGDAVPRRWVTSPHQSPSTIKQIWFSVHDVVRNDCQLDVLINIYIQCPGRVIIWIMTRRPLLAWQLKHDTSLVQGQALVFHFWML